MQPCKALPYLRLTRLTYSSYFHMRLPGILTVACACIPALGFAQATPQLYVGAGASLLNFGPSRPYAYTAIGPAVTVGVQLSSRWAIQTGASLGWRTVNNSINRDSAAVTLGAYALNDRVAQLIVPLLVRFTLTDPSTRLHVDLLAGGSWRHTGLNRSVRYTDVAQASRNYDMGYTSASNAANVVAGLALRYSASPRVAITASALLNADFTTKYYQATFADRLLLNGQLGVQYTFGH